MFILFDFWTEVWGILRRVFLLIDSIGLTFIDDAYDLIIGAATAFNDTQVAKVAGEISRNCYIIIGIFALFRIALMLINSIINPDKLTDKQEGYGNMITRLIITITLFIAVPIVFSLSRELQNVIIDNNYISKILIGKELIGTEEEKGNPGQQIKDIAVRTLIYPDKRLAESTNSKEKQDEEKEEEKKEEEKKEEESNKAEFVPIENSLCDDACKAAVDAWNADVSYDTLNMYIASYVEDGNEMIMIYHYTPFVTLIVGIFITYVLFSFAIDIALRSVELVVLEILSPLFIVTYIDPKQGSKGTFSNWLSACAKTYLNLFIRIAIICLMLLLISKMNDLFEIATGSSGLLQLLMIIAILIFAKKAPKWISDMIGIGGGVGELGIGKKLGGAALVGGAIGTGIGAATKWGKQKGKNFVGNRLRNTAARVGGMHEAHQNNIKNKKISGDNYNRQGLWSAGRAAAKASMANNWGANSQGIIKDISSGMVGGRLNINPNANVLSPTERMKLRVGNNSQKYNESIGNSKEIREKLADIAKDNKVAQKLYLDKNIIDKNSHEGDRIKLDGAYVFPQGNKEMNAAFNHPVTTTQAYEAFGSRLAKHNGLTVANNQVQLKDGTTMDIAEYGIKNMSYSGRLAVESLVASNVAKDISKYRTDKQQLQIATTALSTAITQFNQASDRFNKDPNVIQSNAVIEKYEQFVQQKESARQQISTIKNSNDYQYLTSSTNLTAEEQNRLASYNMKIKQAEVVASDAANNIKTEQKAYDDAQSKIKEAKDSYGISQIELNVKDAQEKVKAWQKQVEDMETKFNTESPVYDENGKIKMENGKVKTENPYTVKLETGEEISLADKDSIIRIEDICATLHKKSEKSESKFKESIKEENSTSTK